MIHFEEIKGTPKYRQLILAITKSIENKTLKKGDQLPSINSICNDFKLSRDTVMIAFNELKAKGIIYSTPGKGYFVKSTKIEERRNIFLLFDELNAFKEDLYNSFLENIGQNDNVEIYFHHFNRQVFEKLILENATKFTHYVIMPAMFEKLDNILKYLPSEKIYILDQSKEELQGLYSAVYQNFSKDVFSALTSGLDLLEKYRKLILVFPGGKEPKGQLIGFKEFCNEWKGEWEVISSPIGRTISEGEVYIMPNDRHLVYLVKEAKRLSLKIGTQIGLISYNDTPLKEVVAGGITTISTDFSLMGKTLAELLQGKKRLEIENPSQLIRRASL